METQCNRGECSLYAGDYEAATSDFDVVQSSGDKHLMARAQQLQGVLSALGDYRPPQPLPPKLADEATFTLADGRELPLAQSRFSPPPIEPGEDWRADEETVTAYNSAIAALFEPLDEFEREEPATTEHTEASVQDPKPASEPLGEDDSTQTATFVLDQGLQREQAAAEPDGTGESDFTNTALMPGRPAALALAEELRKKHSPTTFRKEVTATAIVRRRQQLPLEDEETLTVAGEILELLPEEGSS